jgi:hypothetical protein
VFSLKKIEWLTGYDTPLLQVAEAGMSVEEQCLSNSIEKEKTIDCVADDLRGRPQSLGRRSKALCS